jgi:P-type Cu2+ transporter
MNIEHHCMHGHTEHNNSQKDPLTRAHNGEHDKHEGHSEEMFKKLFWISLFLTLPVIVYSEMIQEWLKFSPPAFPGSNFIPLVFGSIVFFYGGSVFLKGALAELKIRLPGMMTLISLAITAAYIYSVGSSIFGGEMEFFWDLSTLITIMLFGHWMEMKSVSRAKGALKELAKLLPDVAELDSGKKVLVSELRVGDKLLVRPGSKIPADGMVYEGESEVNESMITGESRSVAKQPGSKTVAGTVNLTGALKISVSETGEGTVLSGIMRLVSEAERSHSRSQILADRAAFYLTIAAISVGVLSFGFWNFAEGAQYAIQRAVTVMVIACPHALGLAVPLVTSISTSIGARSGILVRRRPALESARKVATVLFDKTGTLTFGSHGVTDIWSEKGNDEKQLLQLAASVESRSEHSLGKAVVDKAKESNIQIKQVEGFSTQSGRGIFGSVEGTKIAIGGPKLIDEKGKKPSPELSSKISGAESDGKTIIYVFAENDLMGVIALTDMVRPESKEAVEALKRSGIKVAMLTGDSEAAAGYVARQLNIDRYFSQVLPEKKAEKVRQLKEEGGLVAMVGDGINDAPALALADVGIAIGAGTDVAVESAGIVLMKNDPRDVHRIIRLSTSTYSKMVQNLWWAAGYNIIALPLAAGVLAPVGIIISPAIGAVLMSASTIIVAFNAQLLRKFKM